MTPRLRLAGKLLLLIAATLLATACRHTCTCQRYDGSVSTFTLDEVDALDRTCSDMVNSDMGLVYSRCDKTFD